MAAWVCSLLLQLAKTTSPPSFSMVWVKTACLADTALLAWWRG